MSGVSIGVQISDQEVRQGFTRLISVMDNTTPVMSAIGTGVVASTHRRFISQTSPEGAPWARVHPEYKRIKRNSRILTESGRLRDSINSQASRDSVRVGTNVVYALAHQMGAVIKPKSSSHLVFRLASGIVLAKSVTIPARPFMGLTDDDQQMVAETVFRFLSRFN